MKDNQINQIFNLTGMKIEHIDEIGSEDVELQRACVRLIHSALGFPKDAFLCLQIEPDFSSYSFSSENVNISNDDFNWIFEGCAKASSHTTGFTENFFDESRKIYIIQSVNDMKNVNIEGTALYKKIKQSQSLRLFSDMFQMFKEDGAVVRIYIHSNQSHHGMILLSLPQEMSLRMRAIISMSFPNTRVIETTAIYEYSDGYLSDEILFDSLTNILSFLISLQEGKKQKENGEESNFPNEEDYFDCNMPLDDILDIDEDDQKYDSNTLIEVLDLSIRPHNCLKRAGVKTIRDLEKLTDYDLMHIRNMGRKSMEQIKQKLEEYKKNVKVPELNSINYMAMLDEMIGLKEVKEQVKKIIAFAKMKKDFAKTEKKDLFASLNMEFVGNPGTAKTTVARILAGIFHEIGLLQSNEIVEVGRADLIAEYLGQTAVKVKKIFEKAKGKLLFIDEAYSLIDYHEGTYTDEALNTIVQEIENNRNDTFVIFAGYPEKMKGLFERNPGLRSRVPFSIRFNDYTTDELIQITELEANKRGFIISKKAFDKISNIVVEVKENSDFGNGRFCRNLVENAILNYASRVYGYDSNTDKEVVLISDDFSPLSENNTNVIKCIGFHT